MIIRNIFVFTLALSDLLLTASVPFTVLDALTQVQVLIKNKCNTMFSISPSMLIYSSQARVQAKYQNIHLGTHLVHLFYHPTGLASSQFAFRVQVFLIILAHMLIRAFQSWQKQLQLQYLDQVYNREKVSSTSNQSTSFIFEDYTHKRGVNM